MSQAHAAFPPEPGAADKARDETLDRQWWAAGPRRAAVAGAATPRGAATGAVRLPTRAPARAPVPSPAPDAAAPSGWYPEPPRLRYWDGERWTEDTRFARPPVAGTRVGVSVLVSTPAQVAAVVPAAPAPVLEGPPAEASNVQAPEAAGNGLVAAPAPAVQAEQLDEAPEAGDGGIVHELAVLLLVAVVALTVGAMVAALGIAFTA